LFHRGDAKTLRKNYKKDTLRLRAFAVKNILGFFEIPIISQLFNSSDRPMCGILFFQSILLSFIRSSLTKRKVIRLVGVIVQENEPIDRALRRFKKKYERSGILKEFKKRTYFTKPSVRKRMKRVKAIRRSLKLASELG